MPIEIEILDGAFQGQSEDFDDAISDIPVGRDPRCVIQFPPEQTIVGRIHCTIRRENDRYRLVLDRENRVFVNGREAYDGDELPREAELRLGPDGPRLRVLTIVRGAAPEDRAQGLRSTEGERVRAEVRSRVYIAAGIVAMLLVGLWIGQRLMEQLESGLGERLQALNEDLRSLGPELQRHLHGASPSVYLAMMQSDEGERGLGTAWAVGTGTLATNAHVAAAFEEVEKLPNARVVVRSSVPPYETFRIESVALHPAYARFNEVWQEYQPIQQDITGVPAPYHHVGAYDVALMQLSKEVAGNLAEPLPLADDAELHIVGAGDVIGFVGYPMELMQLTNLGEPKPQTQIARITATTDYFAVSSEPEHAELFHHSLPAHGGASGSPILNSEGKVIAILSGGSMVRIPVGINRSVRLNTGVGVNYAQRIDVLRELLEGRAGKNLPGREARWKEGLEHFSALPDVPQGLGEFLRHLILTGVIDEWLAQVGRTESVREKELRGRLGEVPTLDVGKQRIRIDVEPDQEYLGVVISELGDNLDLELLNPDGEEPLDEDNFPDANPSVNARTKGMEELIFDIWGPEPGLEFTLYVYRAK